MFGPLLDRAQPHDPDEHATRIDEPPVPAKSSLRFRVGCQDARLCHQLAGAVFSIHHMKIDRRLDEARPRKLQELRSAADGLSPSLEPPELTHDAEDELPSWLLAE